MNLNASRETPVPFPTTPDEFVPIGAIDGQMNSYGDRIVLVGLHGTSGARMVRLARMPNRPGTQFVACEKDEIRIRGYYTLGRRVFLTGSAGLRGLLQEPGTLNTIVDALRRRKNSETGVAPLQMRFVGELECCLLRQQGRWTDLTPRHVGPALVGLNATDGIAYAIRLRTEGRSLEIVMAANTEDPVMDWRSVGTAPVGKHILDASRFERDVEGNAVSLVSLEGSDFRLVTITPRGKAHWSESISLPGDAIERDTTDPRIPTATSILTQRWVVDGFLVTRHPLQNFTGLVLWAYIKALG
ncbi:hypothetical protein K8R04_04155 [Candidatus Uhrbacteria bacterium]|nr:hypothetical protein [Candidatus Uhrbacteria bacterium]